MCSFEWNDVTKQILCDQMPTIYEWFLTENLKKYSHMQEISTFIILLELLITLKEDKLLNS